MKRNMTKIVAFALGLLFLASSAVSFAQNNTFPTNGKVGVGTTNPDNQLEVVGTTELKGDVHIDSCLIVDDTVQMRKSLIVEGDLILQGLASPTAPPTRFLVVDENGVARGGGGGPEILEIIMEPTWATCDAVAPPGYVPHWEANGTSILYTYCPENLKVGIGTPQPNTRLDVRGTGHFDKNVSIGVNDRTKARLTLANNGHNATVLLVQNGSNGPPSVRTFVKSKTDLPLDKAFVTEFAGQENFVVYGDGMVMGREFKITLDPLSHPDYVFKDDYDLMSLANLEKYLDQNGHLPGIPSQKDVAENNGIELGAMQTKLLEKIEELTLYSIQMQKQLNVLQEQNKGMQIELNTLKQ